MRQLPNDKNAEASVLSAMMINQNAIIKAIEKLSFNDFYFKPHQIIFKDMIELFEENKPVDTITIIDKLRTNNHIEQVGGELYIDNVSDVVIRGTNIDSHIEIVLKKSKLRELIQQCKKTEDACYNETENTEDIIDNIQKNVLSLNNTKDKPFYTAQEACERAIKLIEYRMTNDYSKSKIVSGIQKLDDILQIEPGQTCIIDGRTSNGKTILALQYAMLNCVSRNKKVAVFTMEMLVEYLIFREVSRISSQNKYESEMITHRQVKYPQKANEKQQEIISNILAELAEKDFVFDHTPNQTGQQMLAKCMQIKHLLKGLDLVVIDYIQLMRSTENKSREQQVSEFSKALKIIATNLEVPVIGLSQVNADGSARESRAVEHDADCRISVLIPRNNDQLENHSIRVGSRKIDFEKIPENLGIIKVKKNRHGTLSHDILVEFDGDHQLFKEWNGEIYDSEV